MYFKEETQRQTQNSQEDGALENMLAPGVGSGVVLLCLWLYLQEGL